MTPEILNGFLALFAAASGVNLAYLALPDYRYRNSITEYFEYYIRRQTQLSSGIRDDISVDRDTARQLIKRARDRQLNKMSATEVPDLEKLEPWLCFLESLISMPKGHIPNLNIQIRKAERTKHKSDKKNWFLTLPGCAFRAIFMAHRDNAIVTLLGPVDVQLNLSIVAARDMNAAKLVSVLQ